MADDSYRNPCGGRSSATRRRAGFLLPWPTEEKRNKNGLFDRIPRRWHRRRAPARREPCGRAHVGHRFQLCHAVRERERFSGDGITGRLFHFQRHDPAALATVPDHRHPRRLHHLLGLLARYNPALRARPTGPGDALRHRFGRTFGRRPASRARADAPLRLTFPFARASWAREIASSTSFSAPFTSSHFTIVTHLPFSKSL